MNYTAAPSPLFLFVFLSLLLLVTSSKNGYLYRTCGTDNKTSDLPATSHDNNIFSSFLTNLTLAASRTGHATAVLNKTIENTVLNKTIENTTTTYSASEWIYALAQCRQDVFLAGENNTNLCLNCLAAASAAIQLNCIDRSNTTIFFEHCTLRYANYSFFGQLETSPCPVVYSNPHDVDNATVSVFEQKLENLMDFIKVTATESKGLGKNSTRIRSFVDLYVLVQCTQDLSDMDCVNCLETATNYMTTMNGNNSCKDKRGCQVMSPSCYLRYEFYTFFYPLVASALPAVDEP